MIKAIFGTFNIDMLPIETIDVSDKIIDYMNGNVVVIPKQTIFTNIFGNIGSHKKKYLQISANDRIYNILDDQYFKDIEIDLSRDSNKIKIVYYFFTSPNSNWRAILSGQLYQLKSFGILTEADLYIHVTDTNSYIEEIKKLIYTIVPGAKVSESSENQFEYPAIKLVYDLAKQYPDNNFIYFHSKGMTHNLHSRSLQEMMLFTKSFENWRKNLQLLDQDGVNKAGLFSAELGWIWYNFWYARGKYLATCAEPEVSNFRYYYESWLGLADPNRTIPATDCINLFQIKNISKKYYTPKEADIYKENVMEKMFSHAERKDFRIVRTHSMIYYQLKVDSFFKFFKKSNLTRLYTPQQPGIKKKGK